MSAMVPQITGIPIVCSTLCSGADQRQYQSSASLAFVRGIHRRGFPSPCASNAANISIWWRHHVFFTITPWNGKGCHTTCPLEFTGGGYPSQTVNNVEILVFSYEQAVEQNNLIAVIGDATTHIRPCAHFCYKMMHYGIWDRCIVRFVRFVRSIPLAVTVSGPPSLFGSAMQLVCYIFPRYLRLYISCNLCISICVHMA